MNTKSAYLLIEERIAADKRGSILHRWRYGRELLKAKAGRQRLPKGFTASLMAEAERAGLKGLSDREIQYRMAFASAYPTERHSRTAVRLFGTWTELRDAGFPPVDEGFAKRLDLIEQSTAVMLAGAGGDMNANALDAYNAGRAA